MVVVYNGSASTASILRFTAFLRAGGSSSRGATGGAGTTGALSISKIRLRSFAEMLLDPEGICVAKLGSLRTLADMTALWFCSWMMDSAK